jgi:2,3-dihydroxy-p-cumate/2,3-dihydroxybenzoate 3,4-dioxygenase
MMSVADIRYRRLGYLALTVTDPLRSMEFYRDIVGIAAEQAADGETVLLRCSDRHHDLTLHKGDRPALKRIGWEMESPAAMAALGIAVIAVPDAEADMLGLRDAVRISEPTTGATWEFYSSMAAADTPFEPTHTNIAQLGHVVLNSPRKEDTERFLQEELNFRVSDRIGPAATFMRCFPNPNHHSFGVGPGEAAKLGHLNFMVTDIDDIGRANVRMKRNAVPIAYGPGRHPTSNSIFFYFLDPDGITIEYSFGMEEFPEIDAREPRMFPLEPLSFDSWGGSPETGFSQVGEVEKLPA